MFVYIREAHPSDSGWPDPQTPIKDPRSLTERNEVARTCCNKLDLTLPQVVDELDDRVSLAYNAWPERIYLVGRDGKIVWRCGLGPFGFAPDQAARELAALLGK